MPVEKPSEISAVETESATVKVSASNTESAFKADSESYRLDDPPAYPGRAVGFTDPVSTDFPLEIVDVLNEPSRTHWREPPRWLQINLLVCKITVIIMFLVGILNITFAGVVQEDLKQDRHDYACEANYIADASEPWGQWDSLAPGRYHAQCRLLVSYTHLTEVAGSFSMLRPFLQAVNAYRPTKWTVRYRRGSVMDRRMTPAIVYAVRTGASFISFMFYLASAIILSSNRLITGPPARDSYRNMYIAALVLLWTSALVSGQQAFSTGIASWKARGWREYHQDRWIDDDRVGAIAFESARSSVSS